MKRWIVCILLLCLFVNSNTILALNTIGDEIIFDVSSLGIITGDENGDLRLDDTITRAEFSKIACYLFGITDVSIFPGELSDLKDVPSEHWAKDYINVSVQTKIMSGYGNGLFGPEDNITLQDAIKIVVSIMGYDYVAQTEGGYPAGYINIGHRKGLLKNISSDVIKPAIRRDIVMMVYNSLDVPTLKEKGDTYTEDKEDTLRERISNNNDTVKDIGKVTATKDVWLVAPVPRITENEIEIDGVLYEQNGFDVTQYLGMNVLFYYQTDERTSNKKLINIVPLSDNTVETVRSEGIDKVTNSGITYYEDYNRYSDSFDSNVVMLYNNRVVTKIDYSLLKDVNAEIILLDNNGDDAYDYIFAYNYVDYLVDNIYENGRILAKDINYNDVIIYCDIKQEHTFNVKDSVSKEIDLFDIEKDNIISVFESLDKTYKEIVVSNAVETGVITEISDEEVRLNDEYFDLTDISLIENIIVGNEIEAFLNYDGKISFIKTDANYEEQGYRYGYILGAESKNLSNELEIKMLVAGNIVNKEEVDELNDENAAPTPYTIAQNSGFEYFKMPDKTIRQYGNLNDFIGKPIKFMANSEGLIIRIYTVPLTAGSEGYKIKFNAHEKTFGGISGLGAFAISEKTKVICIPDTDSPSDEDYGVAISIDNRASNVRFDAQGYDLDEETQFVRLLVIKETMNASELKAVSPSSSKIGIVTRVADVINNEGEYVKSIELLTGDGAETYVTKSIDQLTHEFADLKKGDVLYYELDYDENLNNIDVVANIEQVNSSFYVNKETDYEQLSGFVSAVYRNRVDEISNRRVNLIKVDADDEIVNLPVNIRNSPPVFVYSRREVRQGDINDIIPYDKDDINAERLIVIMPRGTIRAIIVAQD